MVWIENGNTKIIHASFPKCFYHDLHLTSDCQCPLLCCISNTFEGPSEGTVREVPDRNFEDDDGLTSFNDAVTFDNVVNN